MNPLMVACSFRKLIDAFLRHVGTSHLSPASVPRRLSAPRFHRSRVPAYVVPWSVSPQTVPDFTRRGRRFAKSAKTHFTPFSLINQGGIEDALTYWRGLPIGARLPRPRRADEAGAGRVCTAASLASLPRLTLRPSRCVLGSHDTPLTRTPSRARTASSLRLGLLLAVLRFRPAARRRAMSKCAPCRAAPWSIGSSSRRTTVRSRPTARCRFCGSMT